MPPLIVLFEKGAKFEPLPDALGTSFGILSLPLGNIIDVADGAHRIAALKITDQLRLLSDSMELPIEFIECENQEDAARLTERIRSGN